MLPTAPIVLAGRTAPSRVLFGPHATNLAHRRAISAKHAAYYGRRAAGGAGIVVTEIASVHPDDWPYERAPLAADCAEGWSACAAACRPHGTLVLAGLGHAGSQGSSAYSQSVLWAPSRVPDVVSREMPMEMEQPEIDLLIEGFAAAAALAAERELDGVEVNAGQHSLLRQFLSGLTNHRHDAYGADRLLLLQQVLAAVREALGSERVLGLRLSCDELAPWAGITPEAAAQYAERLAPLVDYLVVCRGSAMDLSSTRPDLHTPPGFNAELCRTVRAAVRGTVPVVLQGSVVDPQQAAWALQDGVADLVEMTRAQIAEPALVSLWRAGHEDRIRPCLLCNQKCRVRDSRNPIVSCVGEPRSGHETEDPPDAGVDAGSLDVLVVGGGPAGLEAARVLALRGHRVELWEQGGVLGGALRWAATGDRARLLDLTSWLEREVKRLGVRVRTNTRATPHDVERAVAGGWRVLIAAGSVDGPRSYTRAPGANVVDAAGLLAQVASGLALDEILPSGPVVVFDPRGDSVGVSVAELLAAAGRDTSLVTPDQVVGVQLSLTGDLAAANRRLQRAGVALLKRSTLREATDGHVVVEGVHTGEQQEVKCDVVVHCGHRLPDETLVSDHPHVLRAGDCVAPRTAHEAVLEGRRAALALGRLSHVTGRLP